MTKRNSLSTRIKIGGQLSARICHRFQLNMTLKQLDWGAEMIHISFYSIFSFASLTVYLEKRAGNLSPPTNTISSILWLLIQGTRLNFFFFNFTDALLSNMWKLRLSVQCVLLKAFHYFFFPVFFQTWELLGNSAMGSKSGDRIVEGCLIRVIVTRKILSERGVLAVTHFWNCDFWCILLVQGLKRTRLRE